MTSQESSAPSRLSVSPWILTILAVAAIFLVGRVGPESYFGVDDDVFTWGILGVFLVWLLARDSGTRTRIETDPDTPATVGELYRSADQGDDRVYRVVGAGDRVTLLLLTDADGRRDHTGAIRHVDQSQLVADFEAASVSDIGESPLTAAGNAVSGLYWSVRRFF